MQHSSGHLRVMVRILAAAALSCPFQPQPAIAAPVPRMIYPAGHDLDHNRIHDDLDAREAAALETGATRQTSRVIVTLLEPPQESDLDRFRALGGTVRHVYRTAVYGFAGEVPTSRISRIATSVGERLNFVEPDAAAQVHIDDSARQIRVRPLVWDTVGGYGLQGDPNLLIAICDTGIDDTHPDLAGRVGVWMDFTTEAEVSTVDRNGHGSHVAGIAAGSGAAIGSGPVTSLTTTMSGLMPSLEGLGIFDQIKVPVIGSGSVSSDLVWSGSGTAQIDLGPSTPFWLGSSSSSVSPLIQAWSISSPDYYKARVLNESGLASVPFSMLTTYPYTDVGDGFNLFTGIAPHSGLAGIKIVGQDGSGLASEITAAFDWIAANNVTYQIAVANCSVGLDYGVTNAALNMAADGVVNSGTVLVVSAGNDYPYFTIPDPGLSANAITVGAIDDFGAMTTYSSNGPQGDVDKPDVVAPGGSQSGFKNVGSEITSVDTNVNDAATTGFADRQADDYTNLYGTSMSAPHVAGLVALLAQAQGWSFTADQALDTKMIVLMTATETHLVAETSGNTPSLDRGGRDHIEGYGRINADAAVEAVTKFAETILPGDEDVDLGPGPFERKAWAIRLGMVGPGDHTVTLAVPDGADDDLYLYEMNHGIGGEPQIAFSSTDSIAGADESIIVHRATQDSVEYYVVAKWVSGSGVASVSWSAGTPTGVGPAGTVGTELYAALPSPFHASTRLTFSLPARGADAVELAVFDVRGSRVRTLVRGALSGGPHVVTWDGTNDEGHHLGPGVYFVNLQADGLRRNRRIVMLR